MSNIRMLANDLNTTDPVLLCSNSLVMLDVLLHNIVRLQELIDEGNYDFTIKFDKVGSELMATQQALGLALATVVIAQKGSDPEELVDKAIEEKAKKKKTLN